jgi:hypothetical protein
MSELLFDKLTYMDRLKEAGIADEQARAHAEAMESALRDSVAKHTDIVAVRADLNATRTELKNDIALAVRDMTIRMGVIAVALFAALASIKFFP